MGKKVAEFIDPKIIVNGREIRHVTQYFSGFLRFVQDGDVPEFDFAVGWFQQGGQGLDRGGLSRSVRSDQTVDQTFPNLERQTIDGDEIAIVNFEVFDGNHEGGP